MEKDVCCAEFNPAPWDEQEIRWDSELFVKDHVRCLFYIPLNFAAKMKRNVQAMDAAGAPPAADFLVISNNCTLWGMDIYLKATREVPGRKSVRISGTFLSKVFEGPFKNMSSWVREMKGHVAAQGREMQDLFFYYTTCPKCAKKYGKNHVVLLAKTGPA